MFTVEWITEGNINWKYY